MSSDVVIRAEGLGKKYMIGHQSGERYTSLRDIMAQTAKNFARTAGDMFRGKAIIAGDEVEEFWALKDVSFEIKRGDVVGIIGRNGAGKSTLLKVLSRITEPSEGRVEIKGRVASLLEVGTGFHPELTGRENIYLNGAILGMSREEIKRKFDEIVDFSGVEKFLDTPVKRYSSGMYVRLAFAVAAHLEPEILIVDEVLAVGDAEFQKKCLGKMQDVAGHGRTVLFVSHNIDSVKKLCDRSFLLDKGTVKFSGDTEYVLGKYLGSNKDVNSVFENQNPTEKSLIQRAWVKPQPGIEHLQLDKPIDICVEFLRVPPENVVLTIKVYDSSGLCIHHITNEAGALPIRSKTITATFPSYLFCPGRFFVDIDLCIRNISILDVFHGALGFVVEAAGKHYEMNTGSWLGITPPSIALWKEGSN